MSASRSISSCAMTLIRMTSSNRKTVSRRALRTAASTRTAGWTRRLARAPLAASDLLGVGRRVTLPARVERALAAGDDRKNPPAERGVAEGPLAGVLGRHADRDSAAASHSSRRTILIGHEVTLVGDIPVSPTTPHPLSRQANA